MVQWDSVPQLDHYGTQLYHRSHWQCQRKKGGTTTRCTGAQDKHQLGLSETGTHNKCECGSQTVAWSGPGGTPAAATWAVTLHYGSVREALEAF